VAALPWGLAGNLANVMPKARRSKHRSLEDQVIDAAFALAAERDWATLSLADIAAAAGLSIAALYPVCASKTAVFDLLAAKVDAAVLDAVGPPDPEESVRDRLFDLLMQRFDALRPYRPGLVGIMRGLGPLDVAVGVPRLGRSMRWMLEAAGVGTAGLDGELRAAVLSGVYLAALRVWLRDDTPDMAKTMAELDARLRQAEGLSRSLARFCPGARAAA
jgi:AcrR family transcriptional regulator